MLAHPSHPSGVRLHQTTYKIHKNWERNWNFLSSFLDPFIQKKPKKRAQKYSNCLFYSCRLHRRSISFSEFYLARNLTTPTSSKKLLKKASTIKPIKLNVCDGIYRQNSQCRRRRPFLTPLFVAQVAFPWVKSLSPHPQWWMGKFQMRLDFTHSSHCHRHWGFSTASSDLAPSRWSDLISGRRVRSENGKSGRRISAKCNVFFVCFFLCFPILRTLSSIL